MKRPVSLSLIFILSAGLIISCKKDKGEPPVLPPPESMTIDFSNFTSEKKSAELFSDLKGIEKSNWDFAAGVVVFWNTIINTTLIVPVTSFELAADHVPAFLSEKTWQWSYNFTVSNVTYKARLTGQIRTSDVLWKMYITKEGTGGFSEFVWFEGTSNPDGDSGQWIFNESSQTQAAILQITWTKTGTLVDNIKYSYVKNDSYKNNYIEYGKTSGALYDAYYNSSFSTVSGPFIADIGWKTTTKNGRVKCLDYLGDNNWYCWNEQKINIICP